MVNLDVNSDEFSSVKKSFEDTCPSPQTYQIVKIERVQNPVLYRQYMVQKMNMDQKIQLFKMKEICFMDALEMLPKILVIKDLTKALQDYMVKFKC